MEQAGTLKLETLKSMIALESRGSKREKTALSFSRLPEFFSGVLNRVGETLSFSKDDKAAEYKDNAFTKLLSKTNYVDIVDVRIFKPTGMTGSFNDYVNMLGAWHQELIDIDERLLKPLLTITAQLLAEPSRLSRSIPNSFKNIDTDKLQKRLQQVVSRKDDSDKIRYGTAVKRHKDWVTVIGRVNDMQHQYQTVGVKHINAQVKQLVSNIDLLIERMQSMPDTYKADGDIVAQLVEVLYQTAKEVEYFGIHGFNLTTIRSAIDDSYQQLKDALK